MQRNIKVMRVGAAAKDSPERDACAPVRARRPPSPAAHPAALQHRPWRRRLQVTLRNRTEGVQNLGPSGPRTARTDCRGSLGCLLKQKDSSSLIPCLYVRKVNSRTQHPGHLLQAQRLGSDA